LIKEIVMKYIEACPRCQDPNGHIYYYAHVANGVCFKCGGKGTWAYQTSPETRAAAREKAAEKRAVKAAARQVKQDAIQAEADARQVKWEAERAAKHAAAAVIEPGKQEIIGTVVGLKNVEGYAYNTWVTKMIVESEMGWKVYGTMPASLYGEETIKGCKVSFNAIVQVSNDDEKFGFFKRPTKAIRLGETA
jgi:hypothetical protein